MWIRLLAVDQLQAELKKAKIEPKSKKLETENTPEAKPVANSDSQSDTDTTPEQHSSTSDSTVKTSENATSVEVKPQAGKIDEPGIDQVAITVASLSNSVLYVGTNNGAIACLDLKDNAQNPLRVLQASKKKALIKSLLIVDDADTGFAFTDTAVAFGYSLSNLELCPAMKIRDVHGGCALDNGKAAVASPSALRVLAISGREKLQLERSIECGGGINVCQIDHSLIGLGCTSGYFIVNADKKHEIMPLVPCGDGMDPLIAPVGHKSILVVQGTSLTEMATGLVIDSAGDIKEGDVVVWSGYPSSLAVSSGKYVVALVGNTLQVNDLTDAKEIPVEVESHSELKSVFYLQTKVDGHDAYLSERLGPRFDSVKTDIGLITSDGIYALFLPSSFAALEKQIIEGQVTELHPDPTTMATEQGVAELEYLSLLLALTSLKRNPVKQSLHHWLDGMRLNSNLVLYIYGLIEDEPEVFPGLVSLLRELRSTTNDLKQDFLKGYLRAEYKRRPQADQLRLLKYYIPTLGDSEVSRLALSSPPATREVTIRELELQDRYLALEHVLTVSGKQKELLSLWMRSIKGEWKHDDDIKQAAKSHMAKFLRASSDSQLVWDNCLELLKHDTELTLQILMDRKAELDDAQVLDLLRSFSENGDAWRQYLRYIVKSGKKSPEKNQLFIGDFTMMVVSELLECVDVAATNKIYADYSNLEWPRPTCWAFALSRRSQVENTRLEEFWISVRRHEIDIISAMAAFDEGKLSCLLLERVAMYGQLGLHEQAISLLVQIGDFRSLIWYSNHGTPLGPVMPENLKDEVVDQTLQLDLHRLAFKALSSLKVTGAVVQELLKDSPLDLESVLDIAYPQLPAAAVSEIVARDLRRRAAELHLVSLRYALEKSSAS